MMSRKSTPVEFLIIAPRNGELYATSGDPRDPSFKPNSMAFLFGSDKCLLIDRDLYCVVDSYVIGCWQWAGVPKPMPAADEIKVQNGGRIYIYRKMDLDGEYYEGAWAQARREMGME